MKIGDFLICSTDSGFTEYSIVIGYKSKTKIKILVLEIFEKTAYNLLFVNKQNGYHLTTL